MKKEPWEALQSIQCLVCEHYIDELACRAFPIEIPPRILGGFDPCPGGNGVKFKVKGEPKGQRKFLKAVK